VRVVVKLSRHPRKIESLIPRGHHEALVRLKAKWQKRGVDIQEVAAALTHVARVRDGIARLEKKRKGQARAARALHREFLTTLTKVRRVYDRDPARAAIVRSPIEHHVRALLAYMAEVDRKRRGEDVYGPEVRVDFADPMVPHVKSRPGPHGLFGDTRAELLRLLGSRRDVTWLMGVATLDP
jgi:hypothetical protein